MESTLQESAKHIIENCVAIAPGTRALLIYDDSAKEVLESFKSQLERRGTVSLWKIPEPEMHGEEPSPELSREMLSVKVILCITKYSLAHTNARRLANERGAVFLSMPGYNADMMRLRAVRADYKACLKTVEKASGLLTDARKIEIRSATGTEVRLDVTGRKGNCCPGFVNETYRLGSPPDVEANVAPLEEKTEGTIVVDGSITHERLGLLKVPVILRIAKGKIVDIDSEDLVQKEALQKIMRSAGSEKALVLGELGIGFNPEAKLCGNMLVDEGTYGCVHFGFGSNWTIGGRNKVDFHLDFVIRKPTLTADQTDILKEGALL